MGVRDRVAGDAQPAHGGAQRAVARAPADHQQLGVGVGVDDERGDLDPRDPLATLVGHAPGG